MIKTTDKTGSIKLDKNKNRYWELAHKRYFFRRDLKRDKDLIRGGRVPATNGLAIESANRGLEQQAKVMAALSSVVMMDRRNFREALSKI